MAGAVPRDRAHAGGADRDYEVVSCLYDEKAVVLAVLVHTDRHPHDAIVDLAVTEVGPVGQKADGGMDIPAAAYVDRWEF